MIKKTSAVTTTVLGEVKIVGLLLLSAMLLGALLPALRCAVLHCFARALLAYKSSHLATSWVPMASRPNPLQGKAGSSRSR